MQTATSGSPASNIAIEPDERVSQDSGAVQGGVCPEVSPDGAVLREISILDAIFARDSRESCSRTGHMIPQVRHPVRAATLPSERCRGSDSGVGSRISDVRGGRLLVSLRNLDLLMVMSPVTGQIKWTRTGPFLRQHDPDFLPTGQISVFDNREQWRQVFGGSRHAIPGQLPGPAPRESCHD